jgi:xanthine dehydrogenase YagS FAD-binding subunit
VKAFTYVRPTTLEESAKELAVKGSVVKAGGIDLLDRMKERVDEPDRVIQLAAPDNDRAKGAVLWRWREDILFVGGLATLDEIANSKDVRSECPALAEAAGLAASPQIRARATLGGNLFQHTRCGYYRHKSFPCWKRGDASCPVLADGAVQDNAAIFGNAQCASAHPSSLAPVLCAVNASARIATSTSPADKDDTWIDVRALFKPPRRGVAADAEAPKNGVLRCVEFNRDGARTGPCVYEEVRQKAAFDWALASCCVHLPRLRNGEIGGVANVWLGSVAPTPWRAEAAEKALVGKTLSDETIRAAAEASVAGATPLPGSAYKVDLVKVVVRRALERLRAMK